jgi:hypothetical protein
VPEDVTGEFVTVNIDGADNPTLVTVPVATTLDAIFTKSEPFQATIAFSLTANVTPVVGPAPTILTVYVPDVLLMMYDLLAAGAVMVILAEAGDAIIIAY